MVGSYSGFHPLKGQLFIASTKCDPVPFESITVCPDPEADEDNFMPWEAYIPPKIEPPPIQLPSYTATVKMQFTRMQKIHLFFDVSKREARLVLRHAERIRREQLKEGTKIPISNLVYAYLEVVSMRGRHGKRHG